jgi:hypothetical protein
MRRVFLGHVRVRGVLKSACWFENASEAGNELSRYVRVSVLSSDTSPTHPIALKLRPSRARGARVRVGGRYRRRGRVIGVAGRYRRRGRGRFSGSSRWRHRGGASAYETDRYRDRGGEGDIFQKFHSWITSIGYFVRQQGAPNQGFPFLILIQCRTDTSGCANAKFEQAQDRERDQMRRRGLIAV